MRSPSIDDRFQCAIADDNSAEDEIASNYCYVFGECDRNRFENK
ncbi:MAG: hypothetical protein AAGA60_13140 [Cyanobacteria bacterium P01_E01_bin.42]